MKKDAALRLLMAVSIVAVFGLTFGLTAATALARTWTDQKGRTISGKFVRLDGDKVVILSGGKVVTPRLSSLSQVDQDFVRDVLAGEKTADDDKPSADEPNKPTGEGLDSATDASPSGTEDPFKSTPSGVKRGASSNDDPSTDRASTDGDSSESSSGPPVKSAAVQRDWSTSKGPVRGTFVRYFDGNVILKRAGKVEQYSFWTLSEDDQQYVRDLLAARGMPNAIPKTRPASAADDEQSSGVARGSGRLGQNPPGGLGGSGGMPGGIPGGSPGGGLMPGGMSGMGPGGMGPGGMGMGPGIGQGMGMPPGMGGAGIGGPGIGGVGIGGPGGLAGPGIGSGMGAPGTGGIGMGPIGGMPPTGFPSGGMGGSMGPGMTGGMAGSGMTGSGMGMGGSGMGPRMGESMLGPDPGPPTFPRLETTYTRVNITPPPMNQHPVFTEEEPPPEAVALGVMIIVLSVACPLILFVAFVGFIIWLIVKVTSRPASYPRTY